MADWLSGWEGYRYKFYTNESVVDSTLTDFTVDVRLGSGTMTGHATDTSFLFTILTNAIDPNGYKIAVTTSDGTTQCYVEIHEWNPDGFSAHIKVKIPSVSGSANTVFYLYFDADHADNTTYIGWPSDTAATSAYDSNTLYVWNFAQNPAFAQVLDTKNSKDLTVYGTMVAGNKIKTPYSGYTWDFDGSDDYAGYAATTLGISNCTFSFILRSYATTGDQRIFGKMSGLDGILITRRCSDGAFDFAFYDGSTWRDLWTPSGVISTDALTIMHVTYDGANIRCYKDGVEVTSGSYPFAFTGTIADTSMAFRIASSPAYDGKFEGLIGRFIIADTARSAAWIKAEKNSILDTLLSLDRLEIYGQQQAYPAFPASNEFIRYEFTLTGDNETPAVDDLKIPIESFQYRQAKKEVTPDEQSDGSYSIPWERMNPLEQEYYQNRTPETDDPIYSYWTYLSVVINGIDYADDIADRPNGNLKLEKVSYIDGVENVRTVLAQTAFEDLSVYEGPENSSINLAGNAIDAPRGAAIELTGNNYRAVQNGRLEFRFPYADYYLRPDDTLTVGSDTIVVGSISVYIGDGQQSMTVIEDE